jgi:hypothetical protein
MDLRIGCHQGSERDAERPRDLSHRVARPHPVFVTEDGRTLVRRGRLAGDVDLLTGEDQGRVFDLRLALIRAPTDTLCLVAILAIESPDFTV